MPVSEKATGKKRYTITTAEDLYGLADGEFLLLAKGKVQTFGAILAMLPSLQDGRLEEEPLRRTVLNFPFMNDEINLFYPDSPTGTFGYPCPRYGFRSMPLQKKKMLRSIPLLLMRIPFG